MRDRPRRGGTAISRDHRHGREPRVRSDLHGLARAPGSLRARSGQRDHEGAHPYEDSGAGVPMTARISTRHAVRTAVAGALLLLAAAPALAADPKTPAQQGQQVFKDQGCYGCHTVGKTGTPIAPDLSTIGAKRDRAYLTRWLRDPLSQRPTAHMPKLQLSEAEVTALAAYLSSLR